MRGDLVPGRGVPAFISLVSFLSAEGKPGDLSGHQGVRLRVKVTKGILCVQVASAEITNFDYHTGAPIAGGRGEFQEVRVPFKNLKHGWSEQTALNLKSITSINLVFFVTVSHSFRMEVFFLLAGFFSHLALQGHEVGEFLKSRALRILVPFAVGWFLLRPLIESGWILGAASLRGDVHIGAGLLGGFQSLATLPAGIFTGSHLWFLYYLALVTAIAVTVRAAITATGDWREPLSRRSDAAVAWLATSPFCVVILALPTAATLWFMRIWGMDTPDPSLRPHLPVLLIYGGFFTLGWMLSRQRELLPIFGRLTPQRWLLAAMAAGAVLLLGGIERNPAHPRHAAAHAAHVLAYALMMWSLVFLTLGVFQKLCSHPNAFVRYVSDSSYWMYLIHLPIVVWLQVAVAELPLHWSLKLACISMTTLAISLISYDLFVRPTWLGGMLNGRRQDRVLIPWGLGIPRRLRSRRQAISGAALRTAP
ncbi:MAG: acyltransferase family protein [Verrucomicrobia bacterium]|nr:acyltransferase family protein [Verrucomicrobiota bacterium]